MSAKTGTGVVIHTSTLRWRVQAFASHLYFMAFYQIMPHGNRWLFWLCVGFIVSLLGTLWCLHAHYERAFILWSLVFWILNFVRQLIAEFLSRRKHPDLD